MNIRPMMTKDFERLNALFGPNTEFKRDRSQWEQYVNDSENNTRVVLVAEENDTVVGFGTLRFDSQYPPFQKANIPEINDLNVTTSSRGKGIGRALVEQLENEARKRGHNIIGIGVGLYSSYGSAQRLYVKMGYIPDGNGITHENKEVIPGSSYKVDDELVLWFTKIL